MRDWKMREREKYGTPRVALPSCTYEHREMSAHSLGARVPCQVMNQSDSDDDNDDADDDVPTASGNGNGAPSV